eukprot:scaffold1053_cov332-Pavlova_lutheri.AAC.9
MDQGQRRCKSDSAHRIPLWSDEKERGACVTRRKSPRTHAPPSGGGALGPLPLLSRQLKSGWRDEDRRKTTTTW